MKKYVLCPGWITSRSDGDRHFISADDLARLYGVSMRECFVAKWNDSHGRDWHGIPHNLVNLYPDTSGEYKLEK